MTIFYYYENKNINVIDNYKLYEILRKKANYIHGNC